MSDVAGDLAAHQEHANETYECRREAVATLAIQHNQENNR